MRVALYSRVSTDKQESENQVQQLRAFVTGQSWSITHEFIDVETLKYLNHATDLLEDLQNKSLPEDVGENVACALNLIDDAIDDLQKPADAIEFALDVANNALDTIDTKDATFTEEYKRDLAIDHFHQILSTLEGLQPRSNPPVSKVQFSTLSGLTLLTTAHFTMDGADADRELRLAAVEEMRRRGLFTERKDTSIGEVNDYYVGSVDICKLSEREQDTLAVWWNEEASKTPGEQFTRLIEAAAPQHSEDVAQSTQTIQRPDLAEEREAEAMTYKGQACRVHYMNGIYDGSCPGCIWAELTPEEIERDRMVREDGLQMEYLGPGNIPDAERLRAEYRLTPAQYARLQAGEAIASAEVQETIVPYLQFPGVK